MPSTPEVAFEEMEEPYRSRLLSRIVVDGTCWIWIGARNGNGYGMFGARKSRHGNGTSGELVHRLVFRMVSGQIPKGQEIDHICRNRPCINPAHLELVDHSTNLRRGHRDRKEAPRHPIGEHPIEKPLRIGFKEVPGYSPRFYRIPDPCQHGVSPKSKCPDCRREYNTNYVRAWRASKRLRKAKEKR